MKCNVPTCPGEYEDDLIVRAAAHNDEILVFKDVPAKVCDTCGDALISWGVEDQLVRLLESHSYPLCNAPVYQFAPTNKIREQLVGAGSVGGNGQLKGK